MRYTITLADKTTITSDYARLLESGVLEYHDEKGQQFLSPSGWLHYGASEKQPTVLPRGSSAPNPDLKF